MRRRVYDLDDALLARIEAFRTRSRLRSEVDAIRALLRAGLDAMDTPATLIARHHNGEPAEIFGGHPLVAKIEQDGDRIVAVTFRNGEVYRPASERV